MQIFSAIFHQNNRAKELSPDHNRLVTRDGPKTQPSIMLPIRILLPDMAPKKMNFADVSKMNFDIDYILQSAGDQEHYRIPPEEKRVAGLVIAFFCLFF